MSIRIAPSRGRQPERCCDGRLIRIGCDVVSRRDASISNARRERQLRFTVRTKWSHSAASLLGAAARGLLGAALLLGCVVALATLSACDGTPPDAQPTQPEAKPHSQSENQAEPEIEPGATSQPVGQEPDQSPPQRKTGRQEFKFEMDPGAKWACEATTATAEPFWPGTVKPTFAFDIRNEGTADLKIKAKKG